MMKISVIVPMYNSFHLMERNLNVLEKQEAAEIELILIDDCSKDDSYEKAVKYAQTSKLCIKIFRNENNVGPGVSRNQGIRFATGDYITFVDSDDYFADNYTEVLAPLLDEGIDCIIYDYVKVDENGNLLSMGRSIGVGDIRFGRVDSRSAFTYTSGSTMCKIYRKEVIERNGARFGEYFRNEDMPFTKYVLAMSESVYYCPEKLYYYVQVSTSLMHNVNLVDEANCQRAFSILTERLAGTGLDEELLAVELREVLNNTVLIKIQKGETRREIVRYIRANYSKKHIHNKYFARLPKYLKIISFCAYHECVFVLSVILKCKNFRQNKAWKNKDIFYRE